MEAEDVDIVELQRHVAAEFLRIADVPLLRVRRLKVRIEHPAARPGSGLLSGRGITGGGESMLRFGRIVQEGGVDLRVRLLHREERHIQERLIVVDAVSAA